MKFSAYTYQRPDFPVYQETFKSIDKPSVSRYLLGGEASP